MDLNSYHTSYGRLIKTKLIEEKIIEYLIKTDEENLNYEYSNNPGSKLIYITGCNSLEKEIPSFDQVFITKYNNVDIIATDLRKYVTKQETRALNLSDIARDKGNMIFCILNSLIVSDLLNENYSKYKTYSKTIASSFGFFIGHIIDSIIRLNPIEKVSIEVTAAYYILHKLYDSSEFENIDSYRFIKESILAILTRSKYSIPLQASGIEGIISKIEDIKYTGTIDNLLEYLSKQLDNGKDKILNKAVLINAISNTWFGHGGSETILISLEHLPTWMSLLYTIEANSMFKKTRLATIINKYSNQVGLKSYVDLIEKDIKSREL